jgi:hypothetical protein
MGLFGYNQKTYQKNTAAFKDDILALMNKCTDRQSGRLLNQILMALDDNEFPENANKKEIAAVDERIEKLIATMKMECTAGKYYLMSAHASMLFDAINSSRALGKEVFSEKELTAQEGIVGARSALRETIARKAEVAALKESILSKAKTTEDKVLLANYEIDYNDLDAEEETLEEQFEMITEEYNSYVDVVNARKVGVTATAINARSIITPAQFERELAEIDSKTERAMETAREISGAAHRSKEERRERLGKGERRSTFSENLEYAKSEDARKAAEESTFSAASTESETKKSAFWSDMSK